MKLVCDKTLKDPFGRDIVERPGEPPLTLGVACAYAFLTPSPDDVTLPMAEKVKMYHLAQLFANGGEIDLTEEDINLVRQRVAGVYHIAVMGAVFNLLA